MAKIPIGQKAVGDIVKLKVNNITKKFIVVHQGNPDTSRYDSSCDGTWLLMEDIYNFNVWSNTTNLYAASDVCIYLNNTFFSRLDNDVQAAVKQVKIPYTMGYDSENGLSIGTGSNGLSTKVFLLSSTEVGIPFESWDEPKDGCAVLSYFDGADDSKRIATYYSSAYDWWLRNLSWGNYAWYVTSSGKESTMGITVSAGVRPAFILPFDFEIVDSTISGYVNIDGPNKELTGEGYVDIGGTLKPIAESYINIGGTLKSLS